LFVGQNLGRNVRTSGTDADTVKVAVSASHFDLQSREQKAENAEKDSQGRLYRQPVCLKRVDWGRKPIPQNC
jgi:hypothetical protein